MLAFDIPRNHQEPRMKRTVVRWLGAVVLLLACGGAVAQAYPSRPIHFIIPFAAGGGSDVMARIIAEPLSQDRKSVV